MKTQTKKNALTAKQIQTLAKIEKATQKLAQLIVS